MIYTQKSLTKIITTFYSKPQSVEIDGNSLEINQVINVARSDSKVSFSKSRSIRSRIKTAYNKMMRDVKKGTPVYGCNTGYGARASLVVANGTKQERLKLAKQISEGISHIDISVGPEFDRDVIRAAMLIRINMLYKGVSAVKIADLEKYRKLLNLGITPVVNQYGGIGASGDLAHNCRVLSSLRQLPGTSIRDRKGNLHTASEFLNKVGIPKLILDPKAGLGLVNGDNFSTALTLLLAVDTGELLLLANVLGAMVIEALQGTDRSFHPLLSTMRPHPGQKEVASMYRYLLKGSKLSYQELSGHQVRPPGIKVQDGYSLRCISQYHGVNFEKIKQILDTITLNANSVSDNPLWVPPDLTTKGEVPWQWVSGGNFIAMNMVDCADNLRKIMTQIVKLNDRHLSRLVNPHENNGLPANLSDESAITHCTFKGVQIQSGMFDIYSTILSMPVSTMFGVHEEMNQDITSHALTSGILGIENLRIVRYSLAQNLVAVAQAIDFRGGPNNLSPKTKPVYNFIRERVDFVHKEKPLHNDIEIIYQEIKSGKIIELLLKKVFNNPEDLN